MREEGGRGDVGEAEVGVGEGTDVPGVDSLQELLLEFLSDGEDARVFLEVGGILAIRLGNLRAGGGREVHGSVAGMNRHDKNVRGARGIVGRRHDQG